MEIQEGKKRGIFLLAEENLSKLRTHVYDHDPLGVRGRRVLRDEVD